MSDPVNQTVTIVDNVKPTIDTKPADIVVDATRIDCTVITAQQLGGVGVQVEQLDAIVVVDDDLVGLEPERTQQRRIRGRRREGNFDSWFGSR